MTSLSNGVHSLDLERADEFRSAHFEPQMLQAHESLGDLDKILALRAMFPTTSEFTISYILKKCGGRVDAASDELLNHEYFATEQTLGSGTSGARRKGVQ